MIAHEYFHIKLIAVWKIVKQDMPRLKLVVEEMLRNEFWDKVEDEDIALLPFVAIVYPEIMSFLLPNTVIASNKTCNTDTNLLHNKSSGLA